MQYPNFLNDNDLIGVTALSAGVGERINEYLLETKSTNRAKLILEDLYKEKELYEIDKKIDSNIKKTLDDNQKEFILREK